MKIYGLVLTVAGLLTFAVLPQAGEPDDKEIARLISQLGSDGPETREKAEKALLTLKGVPEQLRKACRSPDLEIRSIAKRIISTIEGRFTTEMFARIERLAKEGRFDEAVEHAVRWGDLDPGGKNLVPLAKLARRIRQREAKQFGHLGPKEKSDNPIVYVEESVEFGREKIRLYSSRKTIDVAL